MTPCLAVLFAVEGVMKPMLYWIIGIVVVVVFAALGWIAWQLDAMYDPPVDNDEKSGDWFA